MDRLQNAWNLYERLLEELGADCVLSHLVQYFSTDDLEYYMQEVATENDIDYEEDDEEEEE